MEKHMEYHTPDNYRKIRGLYKGHICRLKRIQTLRNKQTDITEKPNDKHLA
jgi:hypothetical protein